MRRVDGTTGPVTTIAGKGTGSYSGDGGPAAEAELNGPTSVALDASGNLYIGDERRQCGRPAVAPVGRAMPARDRGNGLCGHVDFPNAEVGGVRDVSPTTDLAVDINGYFAPAGLGGLSLYNLPPCPVLDTQHTRSTAVYGTWIDRRGRDWRRVRRHERRPSVCVQRDGGAVGALTYLTLWPQGAAQPTVSTLNALDGAIIVPTINTEISAYASGPSTTHLILDTFGYFAP